MHPGAFLDAGFHFKRAALWGPSLEGERADAVWNSFMQMQEGEVNLYMSRAPKAATGAGPAAVPPVVLPPPL